MERRYVVLPAASKASGVDTRAAAPASFPYGTSAESPLMPTGANRPLAGITVLDFGQVYQGPYATLLMAKAGADVVKIEPPQGEPLRRRAPLGKSTTSPIAMLNSNKRAVTLNLKHERGRALLFRMVERGDVLLENFAPGLRLGLGLRPDRARPRQSGDGSDDPGGVGADRGDRFCGRAAGQSRPGRRRFHFRDPSLCRHPHRTVRARAYRPGPPRRSGDARGRLR